jgi:secondary thiamine-phosphate synthase enzyme
MTEIKTICHTITADLKTGPDIRDITPELRGFVKSSRVVDGVVNLFVIGSTGSLTTIEYEPGVVADLKRAITALAPPDQGYAHEQAWHDGNGHSHVQAALMGPCLSVPVRDGQLATGTWQQVVVINHDNGPRTRKIALTFIGM